MLSLQCDGLIATLEIANPARRNAMTRQMWRDLQRIPEKLRSDPSRAG
jgi:enoyl-CoA hydratase/carnithine racemase